MGPNSIGWAVVQTELDDEKKDTLYSSGKILMSGSRIIPMSADIMNNFQKGVSVSQTAERTRYRLVRRQYERFHLRRERLNRVLMTMGYLPEHYAEQLDRYGKLPKGKEPKLAWRMAKDGKPEFIFREAFLEMVDEMRAVHPDLQQIPYDWTIYYLRKKALSRALRPEELAWVLHSFNQKRGFFAVRGQVDTDAEAPDKLQEYHKARLASVVDTGEKNRGNAVYRLCFDDGVEFEVALRRMTLQVGDDVEYIKTTKLDDDGMPKQTKQGKPDISYKIPGANDAWTLNKLRAEYTIDQSQSTVGEYIYKALLTNPQQKIRGELVRTIDRHFYRDELRRILQAQKPHHPLLQDQEMLDECLQMLYPHNESHSNSMRGRDLCALLTDDIIMYQRPLKSKKSLIAGCKYETHRYVDKDGKMKTEGVKCASKSHPLFQEFRLWQFIENLRIIQRKDTSNGRVRYDVDVTEQFIHDYEGRAALFEWLQTRSKIKQDALLKHFGMKEEGFRWNYVEDREYPAGETRAEMLKRLKKAGVDADFLTAERELALWEILYSVNGQEELGKALRTFARKHQLDEEKFAQNFCTIKPYPSDYCAFSVKALKRLLPLMRCGKYWTAEQIDASTAQRIQKLIDGEYDEQITEQVRNATATLRSVGDYQGLSTWLASYVVYGRHSEASDTKKWETPEDMEADIKAFRQHSLRNPIVEQVCLETLRTVHDIWKEVGHIDEIHVEMGREMRATAKEREERSARQLRNEQTNLRIKALLQEFMNPALEIEDVRPYSPSQQELLHIYEETVLEQEAGNIDDDIREIIRKFTQTEASKRPTEGEVRRYKLWLEQRYRSPYTGKNIPLGKLFTPAYQIEHVIPQSVYYDNSYNNKVICEAEVNLLKGNMLGMAFIKEHAGEIVPLSLGGEVEILKPDTYREFVEEHYKGRKRQIMLSEEIPTEFTSRQMNDTRYIARFIMGELSKLVRQQNADGTYEEEATSKNVIVLNGAITDKLKKDWGLVDVWNGIIAERFKRLNQMEGGTRFGHEENKDGKRYFQIEMPLELQRGFNRKRIDHRHHAMDAIVIACATRAVVNYLNNDHAHDGAGREDVKRAVSRKRDQTWLINKPWPTFTEEAKEELKQMVVSFKQNLRVINKTSNHYEKYNTATGKKEKFRQHHGDNWAIRKALHKESVFAQVNLRSIQTVNFKTAYEQVLRIVDKRLKRAIRDAKNRYAMRCTDKQILKYLQGMPEWKDYDFKRIAIYAFSNDQEKTQMCAIRKRLDDSFDKKKIASVTDTGIQQILLHHLEENGNNPKEAFSPEGIERMNANIAALNNGKAHQPIYVVRISEPMGQKFAVGHIGNRSKKFVEAAKGTNLFFAIYDLGGDRRGYTSLPFREVVERQKLGYPTAPETDEEGHRLLFVLRPGDLVYVPTEEQLQSRIDARAIDKSRIYKMVSCTGNECHFIPANTASFIRDKYEYGSLNKLARAITGEMIKEICIPLEIDRLGRYRIK